MTGRAPREFKRSIELNPNYATAHHWHAYYLAAMGLSEEAIGEIKWARELDPLSLSINTDVGHIFYFAREYDQAIAAFHKAVDMDQNFVNAHLYLADAYARKGMHDEAIAEFLKGEGLKGERAERLAAYKEAYAVAGWNGFLQRLLGLVKERLGTSSFLAQASMETYLELGEKNQAWELLKKNYEQRTGQLALLKVDPRYDGLRSAPRFAELLQRMNLTE
ncbi:MAG: eukaryotic-like serine/threonine-protein kinase [Blastocatellia bacterium]